MVRASKAWQLDCESRAKKQKKSALRNLKCSSFNEGHFSSKQCQPRLCCTQNAPDSARHLRAFIASFKQTFGRYAHATDLYPFESVCRSILDSSVGYIRR